MTTARARLANVKKPTEPIKRRISAIFRASLKSWGLLYWLFIRSIFIILS